MCLHKRPTHISNYCKFQLSSEIEKKPGPTPVYIDPTKTITAPHSQGNELVSIWTKFRTTVFCNEFMPFDLQNYSKQGINSAHYIHFEIAGYP